MSEAFRLYTADDVAKRFQLHPETVREHIRRGDWPHVKFGPRSARFTEAHIQQILESFSVQPVQQERERRPRGRRRVI